MFRGRWARVGRVDRAGTAICVLVVSSMLCGCGGARGSTSTGTAPVTEAEGGRVFAGAVNLRAADLPGAEVVAPAGPGPSPGPRALTFAHCDGGVSPERIVLEARSTLLSAGRGSLLISRVTLWPSEALASRNLAALDSQLGSHCELRYGGTSVSRLSVTLPGGVRARGLRLAVRSGSEHAGEIGYHDIIGFIVGRAEIVLTAARFSRPVELQTERHLLEVLHRRASEARSEV